MYKTFSEMRVAAVYTAGIGFSTLFTGPVGIGHLICTAVVLAIIGIIGEHYTGDHDD